MTKEQFQKACFINEKINSLEAIQKSIKKLKTRENDDEFSWLRETAYNSLSFQIGCYQSDFKKL